MTVISFIDWKGNEKVDLSDIDLSLAIAEEKEAEYENDDLP